MRRTFFILFFSLFTAYCFGQTEQKGCGAFKTGEFAYRDSANNLIHVTRKGGRQQENDKKKGIVTKFKIKWITECEYELTQIWSNSKVKRKQNRSVTKVVITKSNGNDSYEYNCGCKDREIKNAGMMVRLSD
jgi:hypothetical protein